MKKLATILCLSALASAAFAQGTITPANGTTTLFRTNAVGIGQTSGNTAPVLGGFVYGVFTAPSTVTTISASLQELLTATWSFTGVYSTNTAVTSGGREVGGTGASTLGGTWGAGVTNSYVVVGWSTAVAGQNWSAVAAQLQGATLANGMWSGGHFASNSAILGNNAYLGATIVAYGAAGGLDSGGNTLPSLPLFGTSPTSGGIPVIGTTDLFVIQVPEPSTFALAGLGAAALLIFRRRK